MGLEPTTFCMASAGDGSRPFAPLRSHSPFAGISCQVGERARTRANAERCHCCHRAWCHELRHQTRTRRVSPRPARAPSRTGPVDLRRDARVCVPREDVAKHVRPDRAHSDRHQAPSAVISRRKRAAGTAASDFQTGSPGSGGSVRVGVVPATSAMNVASRSSSSSESFSPKSWWSTMLARINAFDSPATLSSRFGAAAAAGEEHRRQ
jgi:hypothetical protein